MNDKESIYIKMSSECREWADFELEKPSQTYKQEFASTVKENLGSTETMPAPEEAKAPGRGR